MKKWIACLLALVLALSFTACKSTVEETWEDQLGTKGKIRIGISPDYAPYEIYDEGGNIVGFDPAMAQYLAEYLGVEAEFVPMDFEAIISAVSLGTIDIGISCFSYKEDRAGSVLFSDTYLTSAQAFFASTQYGVASLSDCAGKVVGAAVGTTGMDCAQGLQEEYGYTEVRGGQVPVLAEQLRVGAIAAVCAEQSVCEAYAKNNPDDFVVITDALTHEEIKCIVNLNNATLLSKINEAIAAFMAEPDYAALIVEWFNS